MILLLILGVVIGFITNLGVGPINAAVMVHGLRERFSRGMAVGVGASIMDMVYCAAAVFGVSILGDHPLFNLGLECAAFVLLLVLGIKSLRTHHTLDELQSAEARAEQRIGKRFGLHGPFLLGALLYIANPTFFPYWIGVSGVLQSYGLLVPSTMNNLSFAVGVGVGAAGWFYLILVFILRRRTQLSPLFITIIYRFSGFTLLGFGVYMGYRLLTLTDWSPVTNLLTR
jgi:L-lysine exporter family protein LysE/ArgO